MVLAFSICPLLLPLSCAATFVLQSHSLLSRIQRRLSTLQFLFLFM